MKFNRCFGCMEELETENEICPHCGFDPALYDPVHCKEAAYALRPGVVLREKYMVGKVLENNGFVITYIGFDLSPGIKVVIEEFCRESEIYSQEGYDVRQPWESVWHRGRGDVQEIFVANGILYRIIDYTESETPEKRSIENSIFAKVGTRSETLEKESIETKTLEKEGVEKEMGFWGKIGQKFRKNYSVDMERVYAGPPLDVDWNSRHHNTEREYSTNMAPVYAGPPLDDNWNRKGRNTEEMYPYTHTDITKADKS